MTTRWPTLLAKLTWLLALPVTPSLVVPLSGCSRSSSDEAKQSAQAAKQPDAETEQDREEGADTDTKLPTIASSVRFGASKKTVRKTETVEREAAAQGVGDANARTIAGDPRLQALVDDAAGKTLHIP